MNSIESIEKRVSHINDQNSIEEVYNILNWIDENYFNLSFARQNNMTVKELENRLDMLIYNIKENILPELFNEPIIMKPSSFAKGEYKHDEVVLYTPLNYSKELLVQFINSRLKEYSGKIDFDTHYMEKTEYYELKVYRLYQ